MKLELKNIKIGPGSEETIQFTAELYVEDKFAAYCDNTGKGGCTDIRGYEPGQKELLKQAEAYCKTLPHVTFGENSYPVTLEDWVDSEVYKFENKRHFKKEQKRILNGVKRDCETKIVVLNKKVYEEFIAGKSMGLNYQIINLKRNLRFYNQTELKKFVDSVKAKLKDDEFIFNTNLPN